MNALAGSSIEIPTILGTRTEIGTFFGRIRVGADRFALFQPPMAIALRPATRWSRDLKRVEGAYSFADGEGNTLAMAKAGSEIATYALDNGLYIPALDESDLRYRALKPTAELNDCWMRSGINISAETPLEPYTPDFPKQTEFADYRGGGGGIGGGGPGPEALPAQLLWTSTQSRVWDDSAWAQYYGDGGQDTFHKDLEFPVVLVRRYPIR